MTSWPSRGSGATGNGGPAFRMLASRCRPRISGLRPMRSADAPRNVGLAADASPLMGGEARSAALDGSP